MKLLAKIDKFVERLCMSAMVMFFAIIVASAFIQVVLRTLFNNPLGFSDELCRYGMIWMVAFAAGLCVKKKNHVAIDILKHFLSASTNAVLEKMINVLIIIFGSILIYYGILLASRNFTQISAGLNLPMGLVYMSMPICGLIMLFYAILDLLGIADRLKT